MLQQTLIYNDVDNGLTVYRYYKPDGKRMYLVGLYDQAFIAADFSQLEREVDHLTWLVTSTALETLIRLLV